MREQHSNFFCIFAVQKIGQIKIIKSIEYEMFN